MNEMNIYKSDRITVTVDKGLYEIAKKVMEREYHAWSEWRKALNPKDLSDDDIVEHILLCGIAHMEKSVEEIESYDNEVKKYEK